MSDNNCIRVFADPVQIEACKQRLRDLQVNLQSITSVIGLAGNEVRFSILFLLYDKGKQCVCDLSDILEMKIPAVSQHLRKMKDGGLVFSEKTGATVFYELDPTASQVLETLFAQVIHPKVSKDA